MKKYLMILAALFCLQFSINAKCITASLKGKDWSPRCNANYLELKNNCKDNMVAKVRYYDTDKGRWIEEIAYIYGGGTYAICFNGTRYQIVSEEKAK